MVAAVSRSLVWGVGLGWLLVGFSFGRALLVRLLHCTFLVCILIYMTKIIAGAGVLVVAMVLFVAAFVSGYVKVYHAQNSGVLVGSYGYEVSGTPGFFRCDGQC